MSLVQIIENSTKTWTGNLTEILKSQIYFLQEQNYFIKSVLQQKQIIIEKLSWNVINQRDKSKLKQISVIQWVINTVKIEENSRMNISAAPVMASYKNEIIMQSYKKENIYDWQLYDEWSL